MSDTQRKHYLLLHFIVFLWGFSPIFGKLISIEALPLIWYRILLTILVLVGYFAFTGQSLAVTGKQLLILSGIGAVIAFHWFCFYHAIKVSNVSVTLAAFSTGTLFSSLIEPFFYKRRILLYEIFFGLVIIGAIVLIFNVETQYGWGIFFGVLAAFTSALFTVWNGLIVKNIPSSVMTFYELSGGLLALSVYLLFTGGFGGGFFQLSLEDTLWLVAFSTFITAFPMVASINLLKNINPYTMTLTVNLETVYGIIWAYLIFNEDKQLTGTFYLGTAIILLTVFGNAALKKYLRK